MVLERDATHVRPLDLVVLHGRTPWGERLVPFTSQDHPSDPLQPDPWGKASIISRKVQFSMASEIRRFHFQRNTPLYTAANTRRCLAKNGRNACLSAG